MSRMHLIGGRNFTFDKASFGPGLHFLEVTITTDNGGRTMSILGFIGMYTVFMILLFSHGVCELMYLCGHSDMTHSRIISNNNKLLNCG